MDGLALDNRKMENSMHGLKVSQIVAGLPGINIIHLVVPLQPLNSSSLKSEQRQSFKSPFRSSYTCGKGFIPSKTEALKIRLEALADTLCFLASLANRLPIKQRSKTYSNNKINNLMLSGHVQGVFGGH